MNKVTGEKEIQEVFRGLPALFSHRILQAAHADAAKPLVYKEHFLAPVGKSGKTAESIGVTKPPLSKAALVGEVHVGPRRGKFGGNKAHFSEFGTVKRSFRGANRGVMPKKPFAEPAFDQTIGEVMGRIEVAQARKTLAFIKRTIKNYG
jgi:hypothetical protein